MVDATPRELLLLGATNLRASVAFGSNPASGAAGRQEGGGGGCGGGVVCFCWSWCVRPNTKSIARKHVLVCANTVPDFSPADISPALLQPSRACA